MRSVISVFNRGGSTVNSMVMQTSCCFHIIHTSDSRLLVFLLENVARIKIGLIHGYFRGCPCLRLRYASGVSPNRTRLCCLRFLCSPRFVADPRSPISFWGAGRDLSVPGSGRLGKSFPERVFSLNKRQEKNTAAANLNVSEKAVWARR